MNINEVKNAIKFAQAHAVPNSSRLRFEFEQSRGLLTRELSAAILIVEDGEIKQISPARPGGLKASLNAWKDGAGRVALNSFGVWYLVCSALLLGHSVEFYAVIDASFERSVCGLFGAHRVRGISVGSELVAELCLNDFVESAGVPPEWNALESTGWNEKIVAQYKNKAV